MLVTCWSAKGGTGCSVVAASLALTWSRAGHDVLLVDLGGDLPAVLGLPESPGAGLTDWLCAGPDVPADGLARLEVEAGPRLALVTRGGADLVDGGRLAVLAGLLASASRPVVVDAGVVTDDSALVPLVAEARHALLVTRPCFLALKRLSTSSVRPSGVVLVSRAGPSPRPDRCRGGGGRTGGGPGRGRPCRRPGGRRRTARPPAAPSARAVAAAGGPVSPMGDLRDRVHRRLLDEADTEIDRERVQALVRAEAPLADGLSADRTVDQVMARVDGLGPLEPLLADPSVTEVMVNGDGSVWIERDGRVRPVDARLAGRDDPPAHRAHRDPAGPAGRPVVADGRRPPVRRLPGERGRAAAGRRRALPHHPTVRRPADPARVDCRGAGGRRAAPQHRASGPTWWSAAAPAPGRRPC